MHSPILNAPADRHRSWIAAVVFDLLDPLPYALFIAALIFDLAYAKSAEILWVKAAAWLICIGLIAAVIPRLINLVQVWVGGQRPRPAAWTLAFWLNALAVVTALVNAFVHSRDAYATMPEGLWLSVVTVAFMVIANVSLTLHGVRSAASDVRGRA
jgi:uncharacterized membrane protein